MNAGEQHPAIDTVEQHALIETIHKQLLTDYVPPHVKRDAHPKMHGCVQAVLRIDEPMRLDPGAADDINEVHHGIFEATPGTEHPAWVRFSNAFGFQHDFEWETRGMAIKVLDVDHADRSLHQDFLLATFDAFFLPDPTHYTQFFVAAHAGPAAVGQFFLCRKLRGASALARSMFTTAMNPLAITYSSQTPYHLGPTRYVKVRARPVPSPAMDEALPNVAWFWAKSILANIGITLHELFANKTDAEAWCSRYLADRDFLRLAMMAFLASHDASFDIDVQLWHADGKPPNDGTYRWTAQEASFYHVATLTIPRQVFWPVAGMPPAIADATAQMVELGEDMSFSPWHTLVDHMPFGKINDFRRQVYHNIAAFRHHENLVRDPVVDLKSEYDCLKRIVQLGLTEPWSTSSIHVERA
jgi:hypothetical protein